MLEFSNLKVNGNGDDIDVLKNKSEEITRVLASIRGRTDLITEKVSGQPYLTINIDRSRIARYGLNISDVQNLIEIAVAGKSASKFYEPNRSFDITVRLPEEKRNSLFPGNTCLFRPPWVLSSCSVWLV